MSDKSNKYGYVGAENIPVQSFGNNAGIFSANDIYDLTQEDKWTNYGQLELIETQEITSTVSTFSLDNLQENIYNVHFVTITNWLPSNDDKHLGLRFKTGGVTDSATNYQYAMSRNNVGGSEVRSANDTKIWLAYNVGLTRENLNGYFYIYNAGDSSKYTFVTSQNLHFGLGIDSNFQSAVYDTTNVVNGMEFFPSGANMTNGIFSVYGIRYS
jgi:hypothetical protein